MIRGDTVYNPDLINNVLCRLYTVSHQIRNLREGQDLYSSIASAMYNKDYDECCELDKNGDFNPLGKDRRDRIKRFLLPMVLECGGLFLEDDDS